jgi:type II restriction/modification system DNA methylase subunit YeeA
MQELETENNRLFIAAYGLDGELQPEVPEAQITLFCNPASRYKRKAKKKKTPEDDSAVDTDEEAEVVTAYTPEERSNFFKADTMREFLSYAVGCMMGRYGLDYPGIILANAGDTLREFLEKVGKPLAELTFAPDEDGIIPVLDGEWFEDDIVARTRDFLRATFGEATLNENLRFIEDSLGKDLRTYFLNDFYKDHLQTYKNRPIYWQLSSGKQKAFQCLVYLHRYTPATLARIRTEYAIPLQGKLSARITRLEEEVTQATSSTTRKKLQTDLDKSKKQMVELLAFDEQLRSYADQAITLDLDDGVKANYAKLGPLVAEAKKICGTKDD